MAETILQDMSKKGNRRIKPRTRSNPEIPTLRKQLHLPDERYWEYCMTPFDNVRRKPIMNTDKLVKEWIK